MAGIDYSAVDDQVLNTDDNLEVLEELTPIERRADKLGIALGLSAGSHDPNMDSVVQKWLNQDYNIQRYQLPSYRRLVKAVASKVGGSNPALAKKIAAKHPGAVVSNDSVTTSQPIAKPLPAGLGLSHDTKADGSSSDDEPQPKSDETYFRPYPMKKSPHGICLIINNKDFKKKQEREGSEVDEDSVSKLFPKLDYKLYGETTYRNRSSEEITSLVEAVAQMDHSQYDSVVLFLASHGDTGCLYGSDDRVVSIEDIQKNLSECKTLVGKPKIIFIQACRGAELPDGVHVVQEDGNGDGEDMFIPRDSDFFFGYATTPDTAACRSNRKGSWYVTELCKTMEQYYTKFDLHHMVTAVHCKVATKKEYMHEKIDKKTGKEIKYKQSPQIVTTLIRPVCFKHDS